MGPDNEAVASDLFMPPLTFSAAAGLTFFTSAGAFFAHFESVFLHAAIVPSPLLVVGHHKRILAKKFLFNEKALRVEDVRELA